MSDFVLMILKMSLEASVVLCAVLLLRMAFRKLPKSYTCILWLLVLVRLLCPVTVRSSFSLIPDVRAGIEASRAEREDNITASRGKLQSDTLPESDLQSDSLQRNGAPDEAGFSDGNAHTDGNAPVPAEPFRHRAASAFLSFWSQWGWAASLLWAAGAVSLFAIYLTRYFRWKKRMGGREERKTTGSGRRSRFSGAALVESSRVEEPFVRGVFFPVIYLPEGLEEKERSYILCHEQMHIRHRDPLWRLLWQAALVLHWFNPLVWIGAGLATKDMEMFCDESVMKRFGNRARQEYAMTLLHFSVKRSGLPFPVAFGESNTESRIAHILKTKRPALTASILAALVIALAAALFLTNPQKPENSGTAENGAALSRAETNPSEEADRNKSESVTETREAFPEDRAQQILALAGEWGTAFVERNGTAMEACLTDPGKMEEAGYEKLPDGGYEVGWSSPWPWETDFRINYARDREEAVIYYYARTSDPSVTVWKQVLTLEWQGGRYAVADWSTDMSPVDSAADFWDRYHYEPSEEYGMSGGGYRFLETPLDWLSRSESESSASEPAIAAVLMRQEQEGSSHAALFLSPESAAQNQLNLEGGKAVFVENPEPDKAYLRWEFGDGQTDVICLKHPGILPDGGGQESRLWLVEDILEEEEYQTRLNRSRLRQSYEEDPEKLSGTSLQGEEGLMEAMRGGAHCVMLAGTPDGSARLYGLVTDGNPRGLFLEEQGRLQYLDWDYVSSQLLLPKLGKGDYDGDGQEELAIVLHTQTGTGLAVEQLFCLEQQKDGGWAVREYESRNYQKQIANDKELWEEELARLWEQPETEQPFSYGDFVYFELDGDHISILLIPGMAEEGVPFLQYTDVSVRAKVIYDGSGFSLKDYEIVP